MTMGWKASLLRASLRLLLLALFSSLTLTGCAKKAPTAVPAGPLFPQFTFPAVPDTLEAANHIASEAHREAWNLLQGGNAKAAARKFSSVVRDAPAFYPADAGLGYTALAQHDYHAALNGFDKALVAAPDYLPALLGRAEALEATNQVADTVAALDAVVRVDPTRTDLKTKADSLRFRGIEDLVAQARKAQQGGPGKIDEARGAYERAIQFSPDSAFLYRELASAEKQANQLDRADQQIQTALRLDPKDAAAHVLAAEIADARGNLKLALDEYQKARELGGSAGPSTPASTPTSTSPSNSNSNSGANPTLNLDDRIKDVEKRLALASMPDAFRNLGAAPRVTRADLAALVGVHLETWVTQLPQVAPGLMTDIRDHWAERWILPVTRAGLMEVYQNHTFQPDTPIDRATLARVVSRMLNQLATKDDSLRQRWAAQPPPTFNDLPSTHVSYPAAALAVAAGIMQNGTDNNFEPTKPVTGSDALAVIARLEALTRGRP
jgi:tetratricopeptide (TPR) repeat protein